MKSIVIQRYANREVRIGFQDLPSRAKHKGDGAVQTAVQQKGIRLVADVDRAMSATGRFSYRDKDGTGYVRLGDTYERVSTYIRSNLDIIAKVQRKEKANESVQTEPRLIKRRPSIFTPNARHRILEAGAIVDDRRNRASEAFMVTLTLPGGTPSAFATVAEHSGYLANRVLQPVRRAGGDFSWFYVWEVQKRGALHMHLCLWTPSTERTMGICIDIVQTWIRALMSLAARTGTDLFEHSQGQYCTASRYWQADIQACKRSVAAYFSKYCSKGAAKKGESGTVQTLSPSYTPKRWWGMSRGLVQAIESSRTKVEIYGVSEDEGVQVLRALSCVIRNYSPIRSHVYNFELSSRKKGFQSVLGAGFREIFYFSDSDFAALSEALPGIINAARVHCRHAQLKGTVAKVLQTPQLNRSMQMKLIDMAALVC